MLRRKVKELGFRAFVEGYESSRNDSCERDCKKKQEEKERKREEKRKLRREERERERSITESNWSKWVEDTLAALGPPYESEVTYRLTPTGCQGGSACQSWQEDMEW